MNLLKICDCFDCKSLLIRFGDVNILCNLPTTLLYEHEAGKTSSSSSNSPLSTLLTIEIHIILISKSRGFDGLDILSLYCNLKHTHIICTRPVYIIGSIFAQKQLNAQLTNCCIPSRNDNNSWKSEGFPNRKLKNRLLEKYLKDTDSTLSQPFLIENQLLISDLIHAVSYKELVKLKVPYKAKDGHISLEANINVCAYSSGYSLGTSNWVIEDRDSGGKIAIIADSVDLNNKRYCKGLDLSFIAGVDTFIIIDDPNITSKCDNVKGDVSHFSSGTIPGRGELKEAVGRQDEIKYASTDSQDVGSFSCSLPFTPRRQGVLKPMQSSHPNVNTSSRQFASLCSLIVDLVCTNVNVIIPLDPYCELMLDLLENLGDTINTRLGPFQQIYTYCIGDVMQELFVYIDTCGEWVEDSRGEFTMHHEDPRSPFTAINEMKESNKLFIGNSLNDITHLYRTPSIVLVAAFHNSLLLEYLERNLKSPRNTFIITHPRYYNLLNLTDGNTSKIINHFIDFRMPSSKIVELLGEKNFFLMSELDNAFYPQEIQGMFKGKCKFKNIQEALVPKLVDIPGKCGLKIAVIDVNILDPNNIIFYKAEGKLNGQHVLLGTFELNSLINELVKIGFKKSDIKVQIDTSKFPIAINLPNANIILEDQLHTTIETNDQPLRERIIGALKTLLVKI